MKKTYISGKLAQTIRHARKQKNLSRIDLASEIGIRHTVIKDIEKGYKQINHEQLLKLCNYLQIDLNQVIGDLQKDSFFCHMQLIELEMEQRPKQALEELKRFEEHREYFVGKESIMTVYSHYLRGKYAEQIKSAIDTIKHYELAIKAALPCQEVHMTNIISASYYGISKMLHDQYQLPQALTYTELGIKHFIPDAQKTYYYSLLHLNKASILEKLNKDHEALQIIEDLWNQPAFPSLADARLHIYQLCITILNKQHRYNETIPLAQEGLDLAYMEHNQDRKYEFLSALGEAHAGLGNMSTAERCYQAANQLESKIINKQLIVSTYTQLGTIYFQQNEFETAQSILEQAVHLGKKLDEFRLCKALIALGHCYWYQKQLNKALSTLHQALIISKRLKLDQIAQDILIFLTQISFRSKVSGYEEYIDLLLQSLSSHSSNHEGTLTTNRNNIKAN